MQPDTHETGCGGRDRRPTRPRSDGEASREGGPDRSSRHEPAWRYATRADLALARRAAREDWGVPDDVKTEVIWQALEILNDSLAPARTRLAAMKLLQALDQADLAAAKLRLERERVGREGQAQAGASAVRALDPEAAARALKAAFPDAGLGGDPATDEHGS